jgi:hypothetical protein
MSISYDWKNIPRVKIMFVRSKMLFKKMRADALATIFVINGNRFSDSIKDV